MSTRTMDEQPQVNETRSMERGIESRTDKRSIEVTGAEATAEAFGGAAAIVLAILGLVGVIPGAMMAVATIVLGAAILFDASTNGTRHSRVVSDALGAEGRLVRAEVGGGSFGGALAGIAGIVLGILALLGLQPILLCTIALIVFGAALLFGSAARSRFASLNVARHGIAEHTRHEAIGHSVAGGETLVGVGAVVLGILALLGISPMLLVFVGFLALGAALLMGGSATGARVFGILRHP